MPPGLNGFITGFELLIYAEPYRRVSNVNQIARARNTCDTGDEECWLFSVDEHWMSRGSIRVACLGTM